MSDPTIAAPALRSGGAIMGHPGLRVLIVRVGAMGDVLHAMPAVAGLRAAMPKCFIGWAIEPRWMPLLRSDAGEMPLVDRVHAVRTKEWRQRVFSRATFSEVAALRREMRAERYDVCVDLQGSVKSAVVGWMSGARRFVGAELPREAGARLLYGERLAVDEENVIAQAGQLVGEGLAPVSLPRDAVAEAWCDEVLRQGLEQRRPDAGRAPLRGVLDASRQGAMVLIAPTAGWGAKEWGAERYSELARRLGAAGYWVLVNKAVGSGVGVAEEVAAADSGARVVESTVAQMIALTRRAALVVGGDTGPVHLAAALGRPVVALYGPTDPARTGPYFPGSRVQVLRDAGSVTDHRRHAETEAGLARIKVEEVFAACLEMLGTG